LRESSSELREVDNELVVWWRDRNVGYEVCVREVRLDVKWWDWVCRTAGSDKSVGSERVVRWVRYAWEAALLVDGSRISARLASPSPFSVAAAIENCGTT
jgi:hypothetical protein